MLIPISRTPIGSFVFEVRFGVSFQTFRIGRPKPPGGAVFIPVVLRIGSVGYFFSAAGEFDQLAALYPLPHTPVPSHQSLRRSSQRSSACAVVLPIIKIASTFNILCGLFKDNDPSHAWPEESRDLSWGMVRKLPSPASTFANRAERTSPCQSGDGISWFAPANDRQRSSIARRRSDALMVLMSDSASMPEMEQSAAEEIKDWVLLPIE